MAIYKGNELAKKLYAGSNLVRAIYAGAEKFWPNIVRVDQGEEYGEWTYDDPVRRRTVTPWEQDVYCDGSLGGRRIGSPYIQEETAATSDEWDGMTYWNGSCGTDYCYVDYKKVRTCYTYPDNVVRYSDFYNGDSRSRRIDGECGWGRSTVVISDWANTGALCNSAGTVGAYDCDGTYSVQYHQQSRVLEDRYPDGSGATNRRTEYHVGPWVSSLLVDGQCGYSAKTKINVYVESPYSGVGCNFVQAWAQVENTESHVNRRVDLSDGSCTAVELEIGEVISAVYVQLQNNKSRPIQVTGTFRWSANGTVRSSTDTKNITPDSIMTFMLNMNYFQTYGSTSAEIVWSE